MKIRFSIWEDQTHQFDDFLASDFDVKVVVSVASASAYPGWADFHCVGQIDQILKFFHKLGDEGYKIHVFRENPVD